MPRFSHVGSKLSISSGWHRNDRAFTLQTVQAPATQSVLAVFSDRIQYVVPIYQRAYVWTALDNWDPLWQDIQETLTRYLSGVENEALRLFMGAIVLEQQHTDPGAVDQRVVIDGQQRLTTPQVVLRAVADVAAERGVSSVSAELEDLTINKGRAATGDLRFKLSPSRRDRAAFRAVLDPDIHTPRADGNITSAYWFFVEAVNEWLDDKDEEGILPASVPERLEALQTCLDSLLFFVSINLDDKDNAQVIFETLNARGMPLNALDLAKNAVFLYAERENADLELLHDEHWEPTFEKPGDTYWQDTVRQGRLRRPRADLFLMHWLTMQLNDVVPATRLFEEFRAHVLQAQPRPSMTELVPTVCQDAGTMRSFDHFAPGSPEALFFRRLAAMDTTTLLPLALLLFRQSEIGETARRRALAALESWLVRRTVLRLTAKNYNRMLATLLAAVKGDLQHADDVVIRELTRSEADTAVWPDDDAIRTRLQYDTLYNYIPRPRIRMLLEACEVALRHPSKTEDLELPQALSIEHVMPQSWDEFWPPPVSDNSTPEEIQEAKETRASRIHRLGNLTLVTGPLNSALSKRAWIDTSLDIDKRRLLADHSILLLNQRIVAHETWDETAIDDRGRALTDLILNTWPGPTSPVWEPVQDQSA